MISENAKAKLYVWLLLIATLFSVLVAFDLLIPSYDSQEIIIDKTGYNQLSGGRSTIRSKRKYQLTTTFGSFPCTRNIIYAAEVGDTIIVERTKIFGEINNIKAAKINYSNDYRTYESMIFPTALWISCILGWLTLKKKKFFSFYETMILASTVISLFMIYTIIIN